MIIFQRNSETYYQAKHNDLLFELYFAQTKDRWILNTYRRIACSWRIQRTHEFHPSKVETYNSMISYFLKTHDCDVRWNV